MTSDKYELRDRFLLITMYLWIVLNLKKTTFWFFISSLDMCAFKRSFMLTYKRSTTVLVSHLFLHWHCPPHLNVSRSFIITFAFSSLQSPLETDNCRLKGFGMKQSNSRQKHPILSRVYDSPPCIETHVNPMMHVCY